MTFTLPPTKEDSMEPSTQALATLRPPTPETPQGRRSGRIALKHLRKEIPIPDPTALNRLSRDTGGLAAHVQTEAELVQAMRFFAERTKMVVEPTGCLAFAAACQAGVVIKDQRVGVIISGGNVALDRFAQLVG